MRQSIVHIDGGPGFSPLCGSRSKRSAKQAKVAPSARLTSLERWCDGCRQVAALVGLLRSVGVPAWIGAAKESA